MTEEKKNLDNERKVGTNSQRRRKNYTTKNKTRGCKANWYRKVKQTRTKANTRKTKKGTAKQEDFRFKPSSLKIIPLGGLHEIGKI